MQLGEEIAEGALDCKWLSEATATASPGPAVTVTAGEGADRGAWALNPHNAEPVARSRHQRYVEAWTLATAV